MSTALVVGAGMTGLATAWHLQNHGYEVTVLDRIGVAGGASWGNAGWLAPGKTIPLANTGLWSYGLTALLDPDAALSVPKRVDPKLWSFVARFMSHATQRKWDTTMAALTEVDLLALEAFDELAENGVEAKLSDEDFVVAFRKETEAKGFLEEVEGAVRHGQEIPFERVSADQVSSFEPLLSEEAQVVYRLGGQRFIEPGPYCEALAKSFLGRGGQIETGVEVTGVTSTRKPAVQLADGQWRTADTVVLANGAWLPKLARPLGVKTMVQAGRGYSFSVPTENEPKHAIYLPHLRVACTPYQGRLRVAGTMEFRGPDEAFEPSRVDAIERVTAPMFTGVNWEDRQDEWVGSRPVTPDGLPLIGATKVPNVYVCGGHGMWGIVLGPVSGKLLAQQIATGETDPAIKPFDPLR
ncbi:NAD(P)/FAD-dependent oxidoreductase [Corynebacterium hindlerae]|uniref:NAD(P)/FAD-dependent oxidoreductase n=1 Tax=Corynebacterium hindlerae TaxID=699041 RepID=UPI003AAD5557